MIRNILIIICVYILLLALGYIFQRHLIYRPTKTKPAPEQWQVADMHEVTFTTKDGLRLMSWYKAAQGRQPTLIYFQGNMGHIGHRGPLMRPYLNHGFGILLLGFRGYGGNPGSPSELGLQQDALAAWNFLQNQGIKSQCIILYGESIGGSYAIHLASQKAVAAVILQSPYSNLADMAFRHYPIFPVKLILKEQHDNLSKITGIKAPVLFLVAQQDYIVPPHMSITLYEKSMKPKQIEFYAGVGHNELHPLVWPAVIKFVRRVVLCKAQ